MPVLFASLLDKRGNKKKSPEGRPQMTQFFEVGVAPGRLQRATREHVVWTVGALDVRTTILIGDRSVHTA